jgi:hypothetical protein
VTASLPLDGEVVGSTTPLVEDVVAEPLPQLAPAASPATGPAVISRPLRPKVRSIAVLPKLGPRLVKPARLASLKPERPELARPVYARPVLSRPVEVKAATIPKDVTSPKLAKTKAVAVAATKSKPLYNPSVTERACNNFNGEPCGAVSSR